MGMPRLSKILFWGFADLLAILCLFALAKNGIAAEYPPEPSPNYLQCTISSQVDLTRKFETQKLAQAYCDGLHKIFANGCTITRLDRYTYQALFVRTWNFEGYGVDWTGARENAWDEFEKFQEKFGWGRKYPQTIVFSECGFKY